MDIHDKWKYPKCNIFCNIMQDSVYKKTIIQSLLHVLSFQAQLMLLGAYTETTLELHWKATERGTLKLHWNYTEMPPLDGYTESTLKSHCTSSAPQLHLQRTPTAPPLHPNCTSSAPQLHLQRTPTAPPAHPNCTSSAPQLHLRCTPTAPQTAHLLAPQPHLHICTRTSSAHQLHLLSPQLHLPAPQLLQIHV